MSLRPLEDYEKITKVKPVIPLTDQEIFNRVVQKLVAQELPCMKLRDPLSTPVAGSPLSSGPDWSPVLFNSSGLVSPMLALLTLEDLRVLKREIGYSELQNLPLIEYYERCVFHSSATHFDMTGEYRKVDILIKKLADRGVVSDSGKILLYWLEEAHVKSGQEMSIAGMLDLPDSYRNQIISFYKEKLHIRLSLLARARNLGQDVLKFHTP